MQFCLWYKHVVCFQEWEEEKKLEERRKTDFSGWLTEIRAKRQVRIVHTIWNQCLIQEDRNQVD